MDVYAPDSGKDLEEYEPFVEEMTNIPRDERREGGETFLHRRRFKH